MPRKPKLTGRGGPNRGQGRKPIPIPAGDALRTRAITILDSQFLLAQHIGSGSASAGIRRILDITRDTMHPKKT